MATRFTGNDSDGITLTEDGDTWVNEAGTFVTNQGDAFDFADTTGNTLIVSGAIASSGTAGIGSGAQSLDIEIEVTASGVVSGESDGMYLLGDRHVITNSGEITGLENNGIVMLDADRARIENGGTITGEDYGIYIRGNGAFVLNSGEIRGEDGVTLDGKRPELINTGLIRGTDTAVDFTEKDAPARLVNEGVIRTNKGEVAVDGQRKADDIRNDGKIFGDVDLRQGNDVYLARDGGRVFGEVTAGAGKDEMTGSTKTDRFFGDAGRDLLKGLGGSDILDGGFDKDTILGGKGGDQLVGGGDDDILRGQDGADTLDGGPGNDTLFGGNGKDRFVFTEVGENDVIGDFEDDRDVLDLTDFGYRSVEEALADARNVKNAVLFDFFGETLLVRGVSKADLADDIIV